MFVWPHYCNLGCYLPNTLPTLLASWGTSVRLMAGGEGVALQHHSCREWSKHSTIYPEPQTSCHNAIFSLYLTSNITSTFLSSSILFVFALCYQELCFFFCSCFSNLSPSSLRQTQCTAGSLCTAYAIKPFNPRSKSFKKRSFCLASHLARTWQFLLLNTLVLVKWNK